MTTEVRHTLPAADYYTPETYAREQEQLWYRQWVYAGRAEQVRPPVSSSPSTSPGRASWSPATTTGELTAFYNVCSHRGAHAVRRHPRRDEGRLPVPVPRLVLRPERRAGRHTTRRRGRGRPVGAGPQAGARRRLAGVPVRQPRAAETPTPLREALDGHYDSPLRFEKHEMDRLVTVHRTESVVAANWKILIENYNECLHCPIVHPELVEVVPTYKKGETGDRSREDGGVALITGGTSYSDDPRARRAVLPGMNEEMAHSIYGSQVFPNMFLDIAGSNVVATRLVPEGPDPDPRPDRVPVPARGHRRARLRPPSRSSTSASSWPARTTPSPSACSVGSRHAASPTASTRPRTTTCTSSTSTTATVMAP